MGKDKSKPRGEDGHTVINTCMLYIKVLVLVTFGFPKSLAPTPAPVILVRVMVTTRSVHVLMYDYEDYEDVHT